MGTCKFCNREFVGRALGGHTVGCGSNPRSHEVHEKISKALVGKPLSEIRKQRLSEAVRAKVSAGTWHNSFARSRTHEYKGVKFYGMWEVKYARWLDENKISWRRPTESFPYIFEEKERRYTPDFYLPDSDEYVEIKGWPTDKDRAKWIAFPKKLKVLFGKDLFEMKIIEEYREKK